jgi:hypothetical protein
MALIERLEYRPLEGTHVHGGVTCGYRWFEVDGRRILQLDTYGSADRAIPGKVSQSLQLDESAARELKLLIQRAFTGL